MSNRIVPAAIVVALFLGAAACTKTEEAKPAAQEAPKAAAPAPAPAPAPAAPVAPSEGGGEKPVEPMPQPDGDQT